MKNRVFITTTSEIPKYDITETYGLISVSSVLGVSYFKEVVSSVADFFGGSAYAFEEELSKAKRQAEHLIRKKALKLGMNAVVQCRYDIDPITHLGNTMFMITLSGTAVKLNDYEVDELEILDYGQNCNVAEMIKNALQKTNEEFGIKNVIEIDTSITAQKIYEMDNIKFEEFVIDNKDDYINEIIEAIEIEHKKRKAALIVNFKSFKLEILKKVISSIDINKYKNKLFRNINIEKALMIRKLQIIDYKSIIEELEEGKQNEFEVLYTLETIPSYIDGDNYNNLKELMEYLEEKYNDDIELCKKDRFSTIDMWMCKKCKSHVKISEYKCPKCLCDRYGIKSVQESNVVVMPKSINYSKTIVFLNHLIKDLRNVYEY